ncbi:hypothetical protein Nmel_000970 [Mimus melanotis]
MADRAENYLESLLIDAFKGKGFQKIRELLQEKEVEPPQKYSESLFNQLDKALRKFLTNSFDFYLVSWFERARAFVTVIDPNEDKFLMLLFEDFFDSALFLYGQQLVSSCTFQIVFLGKKELVNLFLPELGRLVTEANLGCALHLESATGGEKKVPSLRGDVLTHGCYLSCACVYLADYDLQVALSEALCRLMIKKWRDDLVHHWFEDNYLAEAFKEIKDREFETDCRKFLNLLNERLGDKRRVFSFPCISAFADMNEVKKPSDEKLEAFWIDFNAGSQSVTFYVDCDEGALWDSVRLSKENVNSYSMKEKDRQKIVKILMMTPAALNKTEATKVKLVFSAEFEILSVLRKVLGDEKLMIIESEDETIPTGKEAVQNEEETPVPSNAQRRKNPSNSGNVETQKDDLTSQHRQQLTGTVAQKMVNSGVATVTVSLQTDLEDANQEKNSKTPSPVMKAKPSEKLLEEQPMDESLPKILQLSSFPKDVTRKKRNRKTSLTKKRAGGRKDLYDFENSDSSTHEKCCGLMKQEARTRNQTVLREGSNNENTSPAQSEKSWILDSQIQSVPKPVDYTRKRPRVRSKLKVLPVSSASSGSDNESKKEAESRQRPQKEMLREQSTFSSKGYDLPTVDLADETLSEEPGGSPLLLSVPAESPSSVVEKPTQKFHGAPGKLREEESTKRKDSDILSSTIIKKLKFSSLEENHVSSEISHAPKKISDSVEEEVEIQKGQEMDASTDDVFFSKMLHEDLSDSGVIFAFESFIDHLKKLFWSRYKRIEINTQDALRSSEKNLSALLNQLHRCRLNKFETFQKIVVEELANLEKETQLLAAMEKDALDFWNAQLIKLNAFCNQQKQRIESVDSALGETAKSFASSVQNTTYEHPVKNEEENVFIVPSD